MPTAIVPGRIGAIWLATFWLLAAGSVAGGQFWHCAGCRRQQLSQQWPETVSADTYANGIAN